MLERRRRRGISKVEKSIRVPDSSIAFSASFFFFFCASIRKNKKANPRVECDFEVSEIRFSKP